MKLWISGEIQADVADAYRSARQAVERAVNDALSSLHLRSRVATWALISIIRAEDDPDYPEVKRLDRRRATVEFRLKIDYNSFLTADSPAKKRLVLDALTRSIDAMPEMGFEDSDCEQLRRVLAVARHMLGLVASDD